MSDFIGELWDVKDARVLIVDDHTADSALASSILQRAGLHQIVQVQDARLVEQSLADGLPDLMLLDLHMPIVDGFEILDMVRRRTIGTYLPVIVLSADNSMASVRRALHLGAHDYVSKPFDAVELVLRVHNLLLTGEAYQELRRSRAWLRTRLDLFEPDAMTVHSDAADIRRAVRAAMDLHVIDIALQPILDLESREPVSAEALARFPDAPFVGTAAWFAAARDAGLGNELELFAVDQALELLPLLAPGQRMAVNLSPTAVVSMAERLEHYSVDWNCITVELTEHEPVDDYSVLSSSLDLLRASGAWLSIDDAGAGFASLRHILNLRPDVIKADHDIIRHVDTDPSRSALVTMLVHFAEQTGARLVAEGIETETEREALLGLGVRYGQGYLLGRPVIPR